MVGYAIVPDLVEELSVEEFGEGLAEVKNDSICLVFHTD